MLQTLVAGLLVLQNETVPLYRAPNKLDKDENSAGRETTSDQSTVQVASENVDLVNDFVYLGSLVSHDADEVR